MKHVGRKRGWSRAGQVVAACALALAAGSSSAGGLFQCGKVFQDRPCEQADVQQRFSHTQGTFAIEQVNPDTDRDCAGMAAGAMGWWRRMAAGEPMEKLQAEIQQQKISRYDKSMLRDALIAVRHAPGSERDVRSQFETQCMAYKRRNGYPTEREVTARSATAGAGLEAEAARQSLQRAQVDARRAEIEARRADIEARRAQAEMRRAETLRLRSQP